MGKFKNKYVLAKGIPTQNGVGKYSNVQIMTTREGGDTLPTLLPVELYEKDCPEYQLVLERVPKLVGQCIDCGYNVCPGDEEPCYSCDCNNDLWKGKVQHETKEKV